MASRIKVYTKASIERLAQSPVEGGSQDQVALGRYLPEQLSIPANQNEVVQFVEGSFALSVKDPSFLEPYVILISQISSTDVSSVSSAPIRVWTRVFKRWCKNYWCGQSMQ
jgi:hypothetical protein